MSLGADLVPLDSSLDPDAAEERFVLQGVPWKVYMALRKALDEAGSKVRLTYLEGELELMSVSLQHEESRVLLGRLFEAWCMERNVEIFPMGSTTFRSKKKKRGLEADESYAIGTHKTRPELAIEVVYSWFRVDKLDVYRGLGIPEVWIYRDGRIAVFRLGSGGYERIERSALLPELDLEHLASFVRPGSSLNQLLRAYRESL